MKNYLARLVDRVRGNAPRIEPLLAPQVGFNFAARPRNDEEVPEVSRPDEPPAPEVAPARLRKSANTLSSQQTHENAPNESQLRPATADEKLLLPLQTAATADTEFVRQTSSSSPSANGHPHSLGAKPSVPRRAAHSRATSSKTFSFAPDESNHEPPIVRVTIGRIEVRAVPDAAAPKRKAAKPTPPRLTLDDYLKQRKDGTR